MVAKIKQKKNSGFGPSTVAPVFFGIVFLVLGAILIYSNGQMIQRRQQLSLKTKELEQEIAVLQEENRELAAMLSLSGNEAYLEREAREKLQMKKPGETVVVVSPPENSQNNSLPIEKTWWQKILEWAGIK